jgi:hypothetical protein
MSSCRAAAVSRLSLVHPPNGLTQPARGSSDCGERPRGRRVDKQPRSIDEISGDGTSRINAAPRPVDVNNANGDAANLIVESPQGEGQLARRMFAQSRGCFNVTGTNQKIDWHVHEHLHAVSSVLSHVLKAGALAYAHPRTNRPFVVILKTPRAINRSNTV